MNAFQQMINRPVTMDLHVKSILHPQNGSIRGFGAFSGIDSSGNIIHCSGFFPGLSAGMPVRVNGTYQVYKGRISEAGYLQIRADGFHILNFSSEEEIAQYLSGLNVSGCGPKTIEKIIAEYGLDTIREITDAPDRFVARDIPGVWMSVRRSIRDAVTEGFFIPEAYAFLIRTGFSDKTASDLADRFGRETESVFASDPYSFTLACPEIPFGMIDDILLKTGRYDAVSADRLASGILHVLRQDSFAGHVFSADFDVKSHVSSLLGLSKSANGSLRNVYRDAVGKLYVSRRAETDRDGNLYLYGRKNTERDIAAMLHALHLNPDSNPYSSPGELFRETGLSFDQKKAVWNVFENPVSIITGGPGTGKSFITKIIYEAAEEAGFCCMAAAPTGRAARRLDSAIFGYCEIDNDLRPKTLHRLLRASDHEGDFRMNSGNRLPYDLLIIDESSMIDIDLAHALLSAVSPRTRIVFIGDENQLPPVGPGNFFADMIASECIPVTRLTQIFRQNSGSGIIINAERINSGEFPFCAGRFGLKDDDFFFFECGSEAEITRILSGIPGELFVQYGIDPVRDVQVLTPVNIGSSGTGKLNLLLRERLNPKKAHADDYAIGNMTFRSGDKVMQTANDYSLMVYNGDIGYISSIEHEIISVFYPDYGRTVAYTRSQARHLTLAYAVTIHKAQGAETEAAVIVMDKSNAGNAVRKQFYTAVTRARKAVVLIGERVAFQNALSNRKAVSRNTRLADLIRMQFSV